MIGSTRRLNEVDWNPLKCSMERNCNEINEPESRRSLFKFMQIYANFRYESRWVFSPLNWFQSEAVWFENLIFNYIVNEVQNHWNWIGSDRIGSTGLGGCRAIPHAVQPDRLVDWIKSKKWNILFILLRCCCPLSRVYKRWSASTWTDHIDHAPNIQSECNCHAATPKRGRGEQGVEGGRGFFEIFWGNLHRNERWSSHKATSRQRLPRRLYKNMFYEARQHKKMK